MDHIGWYVSDLAAAGAAFERLGFILTPYTPHTHENAAGERISSGTANRCAMLGLGYLEILTHTPALDTPLANQLRAGLDRYQGLHLIAFTCADAAPEAARMKEAGFAPLPVADLRRQVETDDGAEITAAFSVIRLPPDVMAEGRVQMLTQDTPEAVWLESLIARDNAIDALTGVMVCTSDPDEAAARFGRFTGRAPARGEPNGNNGLELALDRGNVSFVTPDQFLAFVPGARIPSDPFIAAAIMRSLDPAATLSFMKKQGVEVSTRKDGVMIIDATDAMGAYLVIEGSR
ncbi:MAG: VOC family protein [Rhodospirillales bacterium]|nr:VOC family protein [Rhodospirillales bacterium]